VPVPSLVEDVRWIVRTARLLLRPALVADLDPDEAGPLSISAWSAAQAAADDMRASR
jgi:hypothetical protein